MKIALCDENQKHLTDLKKIIYEYSEERGFDIVVECFSDVLRLSSSNEKYNIVFLCFDFLNGEKLEIFKRLKEQNPFCDMIFISDNTKSLFEVLKIEPYRFLLSSTKKREFFEFLDEYFSERGCDYPFWIKSGSDTLCFNTKEIIYLEANNKNCYLHLKGGRLKSNCTMARVFDVLPKSHFIKINRAYIVNSLYINKYNKDTIFLKNGDKLRLSRNYSVTFKKAYRNFSNPLEPK